LAAEGARGRELERSARDAGLGDGWREAAQRREQTTLFWMMRCMTIDSGHRDGAASTAAGGIEVEPERGVMSSGLAHMR
jgi:hypothetical protein